MVDRDGVEEVCGGYEVLSIGLLTRPESDHGWSCERVNSYDHYDLHYLPVRVVKPNLLFCVHQRDSEGISGCERECRGLGWS